MELNIIRTLKCLRPHYVENDELICSCGYDIYSVNLDTYQKQKVGKIDTVKRIFSKSRLASRVLRMGISIINKFNDNYIIYSDLGLFISNKDFSIINKVEEIPDRSYQLLDHNICVTKESVYYSEYFTNKNRDEINIWKSYDTVNWDKIYSFPKGSIRHIHSIQGDPYEERLWICTGDRDEETFIAKTDHGFDDFEIVGKNDQKFRTLELNFGPDNVFWGTDCPYERNKIIRYDRKTEKIKEVNDDEFRGPISNLKQLNKDVYMACTWDEGGPDGGNKKSHILFSKNLRDWDCLKSYDKDMYPYLMGYGRIIFPVEMKSKIIFYGQGLRGIDNRLLIGELNF